MKHQIYTRRDRVLLPLYPRQIYLALRKQGYDDDQLFHGLDFDASDLDDEKYRLTIEQHERFILRVLEVTGDPHFSLQFRELLGAAPTNIALLTVANSGTIAEALHQITRYNKIVTRVLAAHPHETDGQMVIEVEPYLEHERVIYFALTSFILFIDHFFETELEGAHLVKRAELAIAEPLGFSSVERKFGFPIVFGCRKNLIFIRDEFLARPLGSADPSTTRLLKEMTERQLEEADAEIHLVGRVTSLLLDQISSPPKLDDAAEALGFSSRGLRRKLAEYDTTYQALLDAARLKISSQLLKDTQDPVSAVALRVGFENPSDFGRAFKKWTGTSPSTFRRDRR